MTAVVDACVLVCAFLPDEADAAEAQLLAEAHARGEVSLIAPSLLPYECTNAFVTAVRRQRIRASVAERILEQVADLGLGLLTVDSSRVFDLAHRFGRSAYDAAYLALAEEQHAPLITADERLYNAIKDSLPWVVWLPEWRRRVGAEPQGPSGGVSND